MFMTKERKNIESSKIGGVPLTLKFMTKERKNIFHVY